jgi:iron complex outermembrane recepter protein
MQPTQSWNASGNEGYIRLTSPSVDTDAEYESRSSLNDSQPGSQESQHRSLDEVVVTAQKRSERLIDVPISIAAVSAEELKDRAVANIDDLSLVVPGLSVDNSGVERTIELRGVSNAFGGNGALVGMYLDEADVSSAGVVQLNLRTYDLERVEVLRGPQGTLYGDGSAGGTIRFIAKDPELTHFEFTNDTTALFTEDGAPSQRIESMLNIPLINNTFGLRIASSFDHEGGWIDEPAADQKNINDQSVSDVRVKALWVPTSQLTISGMANIHRATEGINVGEDSSGNYTQVFGLTTVPRITDNFSIYNLTLTDDLNFMKVLNTTSYVNQERDVDNVGYILQFAAPPAAPYDVDLVAPYPIEVRSLTEELRFMSEGNSPWKWTFGGFYRHFMYDEQETFLFGVPGPAPTAPVSTYMNNSSKSSAVFGDTSYKFFDAFTAGIGGRYFRDEQSLTGGTVGPSGGVQRGTFHTVSPRYYLEYQLTRDANLYTSAAKGFRSGGFNSLNQPSYGPEDLWTYEFGAKSALMDGRIHASAALFYSDYKNYQIVGFLPSPPINVTSNGGDAWIRGVEWDLSWHPLADWTIGVNGDYLRSAFYRINVTESSHIVGDPVDFVPKYEVTGSLQREFQMDAKPLFIRIDYNQRGRETWELRNLAPWFYGESDIIHMLSLTAGLQWSDSLAFRLTAQNLLNENGFLSPENDLERVAARPRPRTYGLGFTVKLQ